LSITVEGSELIDRVVDPRRLVDDIASVLSSDDVVAPKRVSLEYRGSWIGAMPAAGLGYVAVKVVGVYPRNPSRGLPLVRGVLSLFDGDTGEELLRVDAAAPTGWRTAAASALALRLMGFSGGGTLGIIGAGVQATYHAAVLTTIFSFERLLVYSRTREKANKLAAKFGGEAASSLEVLLESSNVVVAATTSTRPVVHGSRLAPGTFVVSVGAPRPVKELDGQTVKRARCIVVDTVEGALSETDDVKGAEELVELRELVRGSKRCKHGEVRVYKSVGTALLDLAVAIHIYRALKPRSDEG
jgi:alanine dehydrogenase